MDILAAARREAARTARMVRTAFHARSGGGRRQAGQRDRQAARPVDGKPLLGLSRVSKRYSIGPVETAVLKGVDLDVGAGGLLSIMGESGSGKSTLLNIMGLLDRPTEGSVQVAGRDVSAMSDDELSDTRNQSIGFVFQAFRLLPRLTAWENVALPLTYQGIDGAEARERAQAMLHKVAMGNRADHRPDQLSGGQQQRVAIARALVVSPALLLADEPTGALDPNTGREIMQLFRELNGSDGIAVVIITHDRAVARQCAGNAELVDGCIRAAVTTAAPSASTEPSEGAGE
ncbi:MAG: ABC transporter ATP-binding protein [Rhodospirillaceae bacterium]|nr:ABC transporter ATP-binding protein [Rhodospirillaceae bacterium]